MELPPELRFIDDWIVFEMRHGSDDGYHLVLNVSEFVSCMRCTLEAAEIKLSCLKDDHAISKKCVEPRLLPSPLAFASSQR
jgi:hypothetical protein